MKIGCLQFAPQVGDVDNNLNRADAIINKANPEDLDILVLPELAVTGYNFRSLRDISPFLEPTAAGVTSLWARTTALKHNCIVIAGYPETADVRATWPTSPEYYNASIIVNEDGDTIGHYRKTHLYYTDETWALEGSGFYQGRFPGIDSKVAMGICMDINPYKFEAPWHAFEFAFHALDSGAKLVILSMAWLTTEDLALYSSKSSEPDLDTLTYWLTRLEPLIRAEDDEEIIVVFANRTGVEDNAVYAGTSAVIGIQGGEVSVYGVLSRGAKELLVVDTNTPPYAKLVYRPGAGETSIDAPGSEPQAPPSDDDSGGEPPDAPKKSPKLPEKSDNGASGPPVESSYRGIAQAVQGELPASPQYSWGQSPINPFAPSQLPDRDVHDAYEEHVSPTGRNHQPVGDYGVPTGRAVPRSVEPESGAGYPGLISKFNDSATAGDAPINRPPSTKSRNASRNRSHSTQQLNLGEQLPKSMSVGASKHRHENTAVLPGDTALGLQDGNLSPDLEKLGADLMVFEGDLATRSQRDSLVCHVDEEDFAILMAKLKDSAERKRSVKPDERAGRSRSRSNKTSGFSKSGGRSQSRNEVSVNSPNYSHRSNGATPTRPVSRGRHRSGSKSTPNNLSKKTSHSRITNNKVPTQSLAEGRGASAEPVHHTRRPSEGISKLASPSSDRHRRDPTQPSNKQLNHKDPAVVVEREVTLPIRVAKPRKGDTHPPLTRKTISSLEAANSDPSARTSPEVAEPKDSTRKFVPERLPPTPKAMVLPPDYGVSDNHQSMPTPPKKQQPIIGVNCLDETEIRSGRPKSAVW
ncbi:carbon-nitrogen hydrolase [Hypoxylon trugodes]|uniref:carbon-nitrogen hydrolase n=1 Tax=Hypoxylon trugodes TaxID=326681 RepID=UPI002190226B|nr:carbon-nitrogen hydrolase [Hypoxylon trugodes]KAI1390825.1 carbon-nitrogen hydrolase [Hypoxylon trugodes]